MPFSVAPTAISCIPFSTKDTFPVSNAVPYLSNRPPEDQSIMLDIAMEIKKHLGGRAEVRGGVFLVQVEHSDD